MAVFGMKPTRGFKIVLLHLLFSVVFAADSQISDLRKCGDRACTVTLSRATVLARYPAKSPLHLSLNRGDIVEIKSKSAGARVDLWGGEINGKRGYFPKAFVKEFDVKIENPMFEVPTEGNVWSKQPPSSQPEPQQQHQPVDQPPQESPPPAAQDGIKDETEVDETDLTDGDDTDAKQVPQEEAGEKAPEPAEKSDAGSSEKTEEEDKMAEEGQALFKGPQLQNIEDLQRSLMREEAPRDPQAFNDFLAKQFGSKSAAFASAPSSTPSEEDKTEQDKDSDTPDSENSGPEVESDVDDTEVGDGDEHAPLDREEVGEAADTGREQEEEKKESDSGYINGVFAMDDDEEEEEEKEEEVHHTADSVERSFEEKTVEGADKTPEEKGDGTAETEDQENKETDTAELRKEKDMEYEDKSDKGMEYEDKSDKGMEYEDKSDKGMEYEDKSDKDKDYETTDTAKTEAKVNKKTDFTESRRDDDLKSEDKAVEDEGEDAVLSEGKENTEKDMAENRKDEDLKSEDKVHEDKGEETTETEEKEKDPVEDRKYEDSVTEGESYEGTEDKESEEKESTESRKDDDAAEAYAGAPVEVGDKADTGRELDKTAPKTIHPSAEGARPQTEPSGTPLPPQDSLVESEGKLSDQKVVNQVIEDEEHGDGGEQKEGTVGTDTGDKPQDTDKEDMTSGTSSEGSEGETQKISNPEDAATEAVTDLQKESDPSPPQVEGKLKDTEITSGGGKKDRTDPISSSSASSDEDILWDSVGRDPSTDSSDQSGEEGNEEGEKPGIRPDKTVLEPPAPSVAGHEPVDIEFLAGQVKDSGVALDSSQSGSEDVLPSSTPALQDSPSLQAEQSPSPTAADDRPESSPPAREDQTETTLIDGTRFYIVDGEIADIVPQSVEAEPASEHAPEVDTSPPPAQATLDIHPTTTTLLPDVSSLKDVTTPTTKQQTENETTQDRVGSQTEHLEHLGVDGGLAHKVSLEQYQTNADTLGRKVLSVNTQIPPKPDGLKQVPAAQQAIKPTEEEDTQGMKTASTSSASSASRDAPAEADTSDHVKALTPGIQPSAIVDSAASVMIEGEEPSDPSTDRKEERNMDGEGAEDRTAPAQEDQERESASGSSAPPLEESWVTRLSSDADQEQAESGQAKAQQERVVEGKDSQDRAGSPQTGDTPEAVTPPSSNDVAWDSVPPPPTKDQKTAEEQQSVQEPTSTEGDPYHTDDFYGRKISDEELSKADEEVSGYPSGSTVGTLEAQSRAFIDKLPPSIQSLLEQEPLGLSPGMTVLVTVTAFVIFLSVTCFSCLCSAGGRKAGTKDPLVVVRELEEKLLMAVKEKENLEDLLQEHQTQNKKMKIEVCDLQSKSGTLTTDLQNVKLHNEVLKNQVSSLQTEKSDLQNNLSKKSDDAKTKDKKAKDVEKEIKKLQESKQTLEKNLREKENECQRQLEDSENLKTTVQSLTDQVQLLDTSKQQLLSEAEDWKEKVEELKERVDQMEQESRQAQETISFKDNELEVMKDCYLQLKAFEKGDQEGEEEDYESTDHSKDVQEKIQAMMDVSKVNATLRAVQEEKDNMENRLKIENDARRESEEQLECVRREMESSMADKMKAERKCQEAQTKLQVLTAYFKDKELELQRELGEQEALKKQNLTKLDNADENTRALQKDLELSRQQVESLKRELTASERDFRSQIAANEKKAHENWLNARAAERELKETRHEAAVLRQKLTDLERRQMDLIRPLPTRAMPPPGMLNGPPPPGMERSPSRGSLPPGAVPPGAMPPGPPPPPFREGDFPLSPRDRERLPPSHPARHMPPPDARSPPPRMLPPDSRGSPPRMLPPEARSPPPYDRRGPPHPLDSRSPPMRMPPPDMVPPLRGPLPPRMAHPPMGSPGPRMDSPRDSRQAPPYGRPPPPSGDSRRHQSQV